MTKSVSAKPRTSALAPLPILQDYYHALFDAHGPQHWWPGRSRFEVIVGAILVQNTAWTNVESAIRNLRRAGLLAPAKMRAVEPALLAQLIRPSGYFRQKTKKLKAFVAFLSDEYSGSLTKMFRTPTGALREQLLAIRGIGPETADSILLYAGNRPVFVVDAYARRIMERHALSSKDHSYEHSRALFEASLPREPRVFNEFHALIVHTGKNFCRKSGADCSNCALRQFLPLESPLRVGKS
ncbi:MAG TPA: hypothetical protein VKT53_01595 [Candidatus Acidoferrum sp.]|nr:hypothetical protein [Candidatus Acidoferrum sp.]